jgi:hypothetical protein
MLRLTKQLPRVGEFTKRGKEVVNYGWNFLTFAARDAFAWGWPSIARKKGNDIRPEFI